MATITIKIPDAQANRVIDAICKAYGYTPEDGPKLLFAKAKLAEHVRQLVLSVERSDSEQAAMDAVADPDDVDVS